ncbi:MAG: class I SAM-dependent methyltransferase [Rhodospirillaceae bacterium]|nr:class I SAM-dependent methyltransferase [Rhodospirillaceae bacterium]MBT3925618.1 class I SAM-dependent methyltransferase [Rhodospirillaceae bacterium]MBT4427289.1 class I SAM-dependent methyltransferase [Rhodospirillaceae bacterium]MBT5037225.1 class I SAM-dependent methyltransferase [Rhodospirillaceae bacterium]MBT5778344.1 class I SAM-dependent methyltransferase [Rhodospirillaceae bacterium]
MVFLNTVGASIAQEFFDDAAADHKESADAIEYWSFPSLYDRYQSVFESFFAERWNRLREAHSDIRSLLDIGCGYGFFLRHVKSVVPTVSGVEIDLEAAQYARRRFDLPVSHMPIERYDSKAPLDCMVMCDVLEHLHKPDYALRRCRDMLAPGGIVFLQVPNHVGFRLPRGHSWGLPHHIWQFNPKSLRRLVESCGLIPEDHYTGVLGVIGAYERGGPTMRERVEWLLARKLGLGNRLMMIARKPMNGV